MVKLELNRAARVSRLQGERRARRLSFLYARRDRKVDVATRAIWAAAVVPRPFAVNDEGMTEEYGEATGEYAATGVDGAVETDNVGDEICVVARGDGAVDVEGKGDVAAAESVRTYDPYFTTREAQRHAGVSRASKIDLQFGDHPDNPLL